MKARATLLVVGLLASAAAAADGTFTRTAGGGNQASAAVLYLEVPLRTHGKRPAGLSFGLRLQQSPLAPLSLGGRDAWQAKTILDVPFRVRHDDPLRDSGAAMLLGKGMIVGIVVGAVVAVSVLTDDDGGGGGGGY
jgi:hypothetical protein